MLTLFCSGQMDTLGMKVAPTTCCDWWLYFVASVTVYENSKLLIISKFIIYQRMNK